MRVCACVSGVCVCVCVCVCMFVCECEILCCMGSVCKRVRVNSRRLRQCKLYRTHMHACTT